jgi:hypothetical protein
MRKATCNTADMILQYKNRSSLKVLYILVETWPYLISSCNTNSKRGYPQRRVIHIVIARKGDECLTLTCCAVFQFEILVFAMNAWAPNSSFPGCFLKASSYIAVTSSSVGDVKTNYILYSSRCQTYVDRVLGANEKAQQERYPPWAFVRGLGHKDY